MPESFTSMLARWLDEICDLDVREAIEGDLIAPGKALIAPACSHMKVRRGRFGCEVTLERGSVVNGHMPSVDVLFRCIAAEYGAQATGVIMTGMGSDGAEGIGEIKKAGGKTLAQDKESCSVFGMPRVAIEKGFINEVVPLAEMASRLIAAVGRVSPLEECHASSR
jgi:two-component system chemotaxis response regulator CheB